MLLVCFWSPRICRAICARVTIFDLISDFVFQFSKRVSKFACKSYVKLLCNILSSACHRKISFIQNMCSTHFRKQIRISKKFESFVDVFQIDKHHWFDDLQGFHVCILRAVVCLINWSSLNHLFFIHIHDLCYSKIHWYQMENKFLSSWHFVSWFIQIL